MKALKLILASLIISFGVNAQKANLKKMDRNEKSPDQRAKIQTERMKTELNLTNEQYEKTYEINLGIIKKNRALQDQKMTTDERNAAVKQNNAARKEMLKNVLTSEQYSKMEEKLKERKSKLMFRY
jgi:Spy/CpxP family protein refolding chaperone